MNQTSGPHISCRGEIEPFSRISGNKLQQFSRKAARREKDVAGFVSPAHLGQVGDFCLERDRIVQVRNASLRHLHSPLKGKVPPSSSVTRSIFRANSLLEGERDEFLGRGRHQPLDAEHDNYRNGYRGRKINLFGLGEIELQIPRDRQGQFESEWLPERKGQDPELEAFLAEAFLAGLSTRDLARITEKHLGQRYDSKQISRIVARATTELNAWQINGRVGWQCSVRSRGDGGERAFRGFSFGNGGPRTGRLVGECLRQFGRGRDKSRATSLYPTGVATNTPGALPAQTSINAVHRRREILCRQMTAVSVASAVSAACGFAANAASAVGVAAPPAEFFRESPAASSIADARCLASAGVSADPGPALRQADSPASGIFGPSWLSPCSAQRGVRPVATPLDGLPYWRVVWQQPRVCRGWQNTSAGGYCGQHTHVESERLTAPNASHERRTLPVRRRAR